MASYCGERFIAEQIASILPQLFDGDELIIVDDHSSDNTVAVIEHFQDPRICLVRQYQNRGVVRTFETALRLATGKILFISDQDDIWPANKVERYLEAFADNPDALLVMSNTALIDEEGNAQPLEGNWIVRADFRPGVFNNLVKNLYMGCRMAFRAEVLRYSLPFPPEIPNFDSWIGIATELHGQVVHLPEALLYHRRHGKNDSPDKRGKITKMIRDRVNLSRALVKLMLRRSAGSHS
jgi:glycosyltransferase involved in cell wall biosynthesis